MRARWPALATTALTLLTLLHASHALSVCITSDTINGTQEDLSFLRNLSAKLLEKATKYGLRIDRMYVSYSGPSREYVFHVPEPGEMVRVGRYDRVGEVPRGFWVCRRYGLDTLIWIAGRDGSSYYELKRRLLSPDCPVKYVVYVNVSPRYLVTDDPNEPGFRSVRCYWDGPSRIWYPYYYLRLLGVEVVNVKDACPEYARFTDLARTVDRLADAILRALRRAVQHGAISTWPPELVATARALLSRLEGERPPEVDPSRLADHVRLIDPARIDDREVKRALERARSAPVNVIYGLLPLLALAGRPGGVARSRARG